MLVPPRIFELRRFASKDKTRFQLEGVYFERNGVNCATATDGKVLAHATWNAPPADHFPARPGLPSPAPVGEHFKAILRSDDCAAASKMIPPKSVPAGHVTSFVAMAETTDSAAPVAMGATDLTSDRAMVASPVEGIFPDYTVCLNGSSTPDIEVILDLDRLAAAVDLLKRARPPFEGKNAPGIRLRIHGKGRRPVELAAEGEPGESLRAFVMPMILE